MKDTDFLCFFMFKETTSSLNLRAFLKKMTKKKLGISTSMNMAMLTLE